MIARQILNGESYIVGKAGMQTATDIFVSSSGAISITWKYILLEY